MVGRLNVENSNKSEQQPYNEISFLWILKLASNQKSILIYSSNPFVNPMLN